MFRPLEDCPDILLDLLKLPAGLVAVVRKAEGFTYVCVDRSYPICEPWAKTALEEACRSKTGSFLVTTDEVLSKVV